MYVDQLHKSKSFVGLTFSSVQSEDEYQYQYNP